MCELIPEVTLKKSFACTMIMAKAEKKSQGRKSIKILLHFFSIEVDTLFKKVIEHYFLFLFANTAVYNLLFF